MLTQFTIPLVYFKTVKTAGTSTEASLEAALWDRTPAHGKLASVYEDGFVTGRPQNFRGEDDRSQGAAEMLSLYRPLGFSSARVSLLSKLVPHSSVSEVCSALPQALWYRATKVVNIRNPWDRAVSYYFWCRRRRRATPRDVYGDFERFVTRIKPSAVEKEVASAFDSTWRTIRYETLLPDIEKIFEEFNISSRFSLPRYKTNTRPRGLHYSQFFSDSSRRVVAKNWGEWIDLFGYKFDPS